MITLISKKTGDFHYCDETKDYHCKEGIIKKEDLQSDKKIVLAHTAREFYKTTMNKFDIAQKYKRSAQLITPKDLGYILARSYVPKDGKIVEAGGGSGAFSAFFANYVKTLHTYEINTDSIKVINKNLDSQGIENVNLIEGDINEHIEKEKDIDLLFLDMPDCHKVLEKDLSGVKSAAYIVLYVPSVTQIMAINDAIKEKREELYVEEVCEIGKREWKVWGVIARPQHRKDIDHTAFLVFIRKI